MCTSSSKSKFPSEVHSFSRDKKDKICMLEASHEVLPGDFISKVCGTVTREYSFKEVEAMIKLSQKPVILHFLGNNPFTPYVEKKRKSKNDSETDSESDSDSDTESDSDVSPKEKSVSSSESSSSTSEDGSSSSESSSNESEEEQKKKSKTRKSHR